jgi:hypothetical protein
MHGELAQVIALAAHGSAWLAGLTGGRAPRLDSGNSTFQYVRRVRFELNEPRLGQPAIATDVAGWLDGARDRGIERFWLYIPEPGDVGTDGQRAPERMLVGFVGPGRSFLLGTSKERPAEIWRGSWDVGNENDPNRRIWHVDYRGERVDKGIVPPQADIPGSGQRLLAALEAAETFAGIQELKDWAAWFVDARRLGHAKDPEPPYHPDMLPAAGFPEPARQLLAMATRAWVFGGMGSWNDLVFDTPEQRDEYERLSAQLYSAVLGAFVAAVNARWEA